MRRGLCLALLACSLCFSVYAEDTAQGQGDLDKLFENAQADSEAQASDSSSLLSAFKSQPLSVSASLVAEAGGILGFSDSVDSSDQAELAFAATPAVYFVPSFTISSRPDQSLRFQSTVYGSISSDPLFKPQVSELFVDYSFRDLAYFRAGKHSLSWGVSRLFDAGGDLMSSSGSGLALKASIPLGSGGLTAVAYTPATISSSTNFSSLTYGLQGDVPLRAADFILSATYSPSATPSMRATGVLKTSVAGVDLFSEAICAAKALSSPYLSGIVAGFLWTREQPALKLYGEYYFNASDSSYTDHRVSAVLGMNKLLGSPFDFGLQWAHAFVDGSGIVMPAATLGIAEHLSLLLGLPLRYGAVGSFYLVNGLPAVTTGTVESDTLSWNQRYGLLLRLKLSAGL